MDRWIAHVLLVTPTAYRTSAAALMAQASGNPADAAPTAFSVPICAAGDTATITHWACHVRVRASTLEALPQLAALIPGGMWHVTAHDDDTPDTPRLSVADWLATQGLRIYTPPDEETT